MTGLVA